MTFVSSPLTPFKEEGCPILQQIYAWHCIVLTSDKNTVEKHNNKEQSKTIRHLTMPSINLSEYWTSTGTAVCQRNMPIDPTLRRHTHRLPFNLKSHSFHGQIFYYIHTYIHTYFIDFPKGLFKDNT